MTPAENCPTYEGCAASNLTRVFSPHCCFFERRGIRSDHYGHDWQGPADAPPRKQIGSRDCEGDEPVAEHGAQVFANAGGAAAEVPAPLGVDETVAAPPAPASAAHIRCAEARVLGGGEIAQVVAATGKMRNTILADSDDLEGEHGDTIACLTELGRYSCSSAFRSYTGRWSLSQASAISLPPPN
ncbi:MAG: hypothetical protein H7274_07450 [Rhodoferax sp.]|nr:hypothetical protein [Rhodoferax sp.]